MEAGKPKRVTCPQTGLTPRAACHASRPVAWLLLKLQARPQADALTVLHEGPHQLGSCRDGAGASDSACSRPGRCGQRAVRASMRADDRRAGPPGAREHRPRPGCCAAGRHAPELCRLTQAVSARASARRARLRCCACACHALPSSAPGLPGPALGCSLVISWPMSRAHSTDARLLRIMSTIRPTWLRAAAEGEEVSFWELQVSSPQPDTHTCAAGQPPMQDASSMAACAAVCSPLNLPPVQHAEAAAAIPVPTARSRPRMHRTRPTCVWCQARAARLEQVLCGYLQLPDSMDQPVQLELNPSGQAGRAKRQVRSRPCPALPTTARKLKGSGALQAPDRSGACEA